MSYVTEVTDLFLAYCPEATLLDPMDYTIIAEWEKQAIPLPIVLAAIEEGCANCKEEPVKIESISYFQEEIKKNFRNWLQRRDPEL